MADAQTPVLTDEQIDALWVSTLDDPDGNEFVPFARAVEAAVLAAQAPAQPTESSRCVGWRTVWRTATFVWYSSKVIDTEAEVDRVLVHWRSIWPQLSVEGGGQFSFEKEALYAHPAPSQPDRAVMQQALDALTASVDYGAMTATMEKPHG